MFSIKTNHQYQYPSITLIDESCNTQAEIFCFGGLLNSFSIQKNNVTYNIIDAYKNTNDAIAEKNTWFKSCKLSPFTCRLENGVYSWNNVDYTIEKFYLNNNAIHGLVYDAVYTIHSMQATPTFALVTLQHTYTAQDKGYPFNYTTVLQYKLEANNKLSITSTVTHINNIAIPYCEGWHPYFKLDEAIDNCTLQFSAIEMLQFNNNFVPNGILLQDDRFNNGALLKNIDLDNCYQLQSNTSCILKSNNLQLTITPKQLYKYLQVFIPSHRQNIAIENLSAPPNAFNNKIDLNVLQPNTEYVFEVCFEIA